MRKLTKEEQKVWDRLKNGIPAPPKYSYLEEELAKIMAEELAKEIDREILNSILNNAKDHK